MGEIADWLADIEMDQRDRYERAWAENESITDAELVDALAVDEDGHPFDDKTEGIKKFFRERGFITKKQRLCLLHVLTMMDISFS